MYQLNITSGRPSHLIINTLQLFAIAVCIMGILQGSKAHTDKKKASAHPPCNGDELRSCFLSFAFTLLLGVQK